MSTLNVNCTCSVMFDRGYFIICNVPSNILAQGGIHFICCFIQFLISPPSTSLLFWFHHIYLGFWYLPLSCAKHNFSTGIHLSGIRCIRSISNQIEHPCIVHVAVSIFRSPDCSSLRKHPSWLWRLLDSRIYIIACYFIDARQFLPFSWLLFKHTDSYYQTIVCCFLLNNQFRYSILLLFGVAGYADPLTHMDPV